MSRTSPFNPCPLRLWFGCYMALGALLASAAGSARADDRLVGPSRPLESLSGTFADQVNEVFDLAASTVFTLDVPKAIGSGFTVSILIDGTPYSMNLARHSVRAPGYQLFVQGEDGQLVAQPPGEVRTVRGSLTESEGSLVTGALSETGLETIILLADGRRYGLEPVAPKIPEAPSDLYVLYLTDDANAPTGICGTANVGAPPAPPVPHGPCGAGPFCFTELACDADFQYFSFWGSVASVENRINITINNINVQYENQTEISHFITAIIVRTTPVYTSNDSFGLLNQFRNRWLSQHGNIQRDVAHLFTGRNLNGDIIGIAWDIGAICTTGAYCLSQSDCCGGLACASDLTAHELGHLWGAFHCDPCSTTMRSFIGCFNNFTNGSINSIVAHRNSRSCLDGTMGSPPTPDPMSFQSTPSPVNTSTVTMTATLATDPEGSAVQYLFDAQSFGGTDSTWQGSRVYSDTGLDANKQYVYRVQARDNELNTTGFSLSAPGATAIETPATITFSNVTSTTVDLTAAGPFTNLALGMSGLFCESLTAGGNAGIAVWIQVDTDTATGLSPDTTYTFRVKARNLLGDETPFSAGFQVTTAGGGDVQGDCDGNGVFELSPDMACFVNVLLGTDTDPGDIGRSDLNGDSSSDGMDISFFLDCAISGCP